MTNNLHLIVYSNSQNIIFVFYFSSQMSFIIIIYYCFLQIANPYYFIYYEHTFLNDIFHRLFLTLKSYILFNIILIYIYIYINDVYYESL